MGLASLASLGAITDAEWSAFRARLDAAGFARDAVHRDARSTALRLFSAAEAVTDEAARRDLGEQVFDALLRGGALVRDDGDATRWRAAVSIAPFFDLLILCDWPGADAAAVRQPSRCALTLGQWMPERLEGAALEVGCGCGALALLAAARGAPKAVGTDPDARAIAMAGFSARLNASSAEFRLGARYDAVQELTFALVLGQPSFEARSTPTVGEGGAAPLAEGGADDTAVMDAVGESPSVLAPSGRALFCFERATQKGVRVADRLRLALGDHRVDLAAYFAREAHGYFARGQAQGPGDVDRVLAVVSAPSVEQGARGVFVCQMRVSALSPGRSDRLDAALASLEVITRDDTALGEAALRVAPDATWVEERTTPDLNATPRRFVRFAPGALAADQDLTEAGQVLIALVDASEHVDAAIESFAEVCGVEVYKVRHEVLGMVRQQLSLGMLRLA